MVIEIRQDRRIKSINANFIRFILRKCFEYLKRPPYDVSVYICGDETIKNLNKQYRNIEKSTDVLSFALKDSSQPEYLGEIIISADAVKAQAQQYKISFQEEFVRLLVHGLLHLLGYDHTKSHAEAKKMFGLQRKLVNFLLKK